MLGRRLGGLGRPAPPGQETDASSLSPLTGREASNPARGSPPSLHSAATTEPSAALALRCSAPAGSANALVSA